MAEEKKEEFFREFNLIQERKVLSKKMPASHQRQAVAALDKWFNKKHETDVGSIVVLPTGGGKTFTALRFLCSSPLSKGYKVLWLAHTHHLLEQAFYSFAPKQEIANTKLQGSEVAFIAEPKQKLNVRVVSGTPGHFSINQIKPTDDVLIITLQTITNAYKNKVPQLKKFLESTEKLFVVFDEAHHSPSPTYARFLTELRAVYPNMCLLGLTATPTYYNERKQGWLKKLFPQGIIYQVSIKKLMAEGILAKPNVESHKTDFEPNFDEREYQKWINTYQDLPEDIITDLAENRERNAFIAKTYAENKNRYKKTIIFAERWHQCDQLREFLKNYKIKADVIYSHVEYQGRDVSSRNKRGGNRNADVLAAFRRNEIDVLINVRMLTEGTDVPDVNTVFLTRQTTSKVLLTQMVGRALRGPCFGGTEEANVVSFTDNWKQVINWAEYDQFTDGMADESIPEYGKRPPLQLVSIELVRGLIQQMNMGINVSPKPFLTLIPIGWYLIEFETSIKDSDDDSIVRQMVLVFQNDEKNYKEFIDYLSQQNLDLFINEDVSLTNNRPTLAKWLKKFFPSVEEHQEDELLRNLFHIARHMAQRERETPKFFYFEERNNHNLDAVAQKFLSDKLNRYQEKQALETEYQRRDRYWTTIYPNFQYFYSQYDACVGRLLEVQPQENIGLLQLSGNIEDFSNKELSEEIKAQVKTRDSYKCLCCNETNKRLLLTDHIAPSYYGGNNSLDNLQTLCKACNQIKDISELNFRIHKKDSLIKPPNEFPNIDLPNAKKANDNLEWEKFLCRTLNVFYGCSAVSKITIGKRGKYFDEWQIELYDGNSLAWFETHLPQLLENIRMARKKVRTSNLNPVGLRLLAPNQKSVSTEDLLKAKAKQSSKMTEAKIEELKEKGKLLLTTTEAGNKVTKNNKNDKNKNKTLKDKIEESSPSNTVPTRALSIRQPYAEQILRGIKKKEFRSKATHIRERVYIYASLTPGSTLDFKKMKLNPESLPTGVLVGTVEIVDCIGEDGDYEWHLANPERLEENLKPKNKPQPMFFNPF